MNKERQVTDLLNKTRTRLFNQMNSAGFWEGHLSSSALATAVAVFALHQVDSDKYKTTVHSGLRWLAVSINEDGGFGDSPESKSNLSTTLLCWSAFSVAEQDTELNATIKKIETWLTDHIGSLESRHIARSVFSFYGNDRTFSAPILTLCALAGRLGKEQECWKWVPQLPLELAALPHRFFRFLSLPVVSYAIPALIAVGLVKHKRAQRALFLNRLIRNTLEKNLLNKLAAIQPSNGGYLEATPLTAFVTMSLASVGMRNHDIVRKGCDFILTSQRHDGSWPIDTDLATWLTTLSVNALYAGNNDPFSHEQRSILKNWLMDHQFKTEHSFTHAAPGGWSWTHLPGAVPDADDTSGALIALKNLAPEDKDAKQSAQKGLQWLMDLQNRDGGIPTFCKGWGKLPFDASCPDITAHALHACIVWKNNFDGAFHSNLEKTIIRMIDYLKDAQLAQGCWLPRWFGGQWAPDEANPVYGTSRVLSGLKSLDIVEFPQVHSVIKNGLEWLKQARHPDGGWGSARGVAPTTEETGLALVVLSDYPGEHIAKGLEWLQKQLDNSEPDPSPIGLYFASLWYSEKLYPLIFAVHALEKMGRSTKSL